MEDESSSLNIEWKKNKGFGATEKLTRRTDVKKALEFEAKKKSRYRWIFQQDQPSCPKA